MAKVVKKVAPKKKEESQKPIKEPAGNKLYKPQEDFDQIIVKDGVVSGAAGSGFDVEKIKDKFVGLNKTAINDFCEWLHNEPITKFGGGREFPQAVIDKYFTEKNL
jgi:hypothetical protein